jgi:RNA polymerase sigma-70 factor (ECF subfamily)
MIREQKDTQRGLQKDSDERARRFRDAALPCLDDVHTLARFLMRDRADADDAVQECYVRALDYFDSWRGDTIKPWLLMILRNVCYSQLSRRSRRETSVDLADDESPNRLPLWQEPQALQDSEISDRQEAVAIRQLVDSLPAPFREVIVLRELNDLSYREIAEVAGDPMGTVMSRLARARAMLRARWKAREAHSLAPALSMMLVDGQ